jgi:hypothetical protein
VVRERGFVREEPILAAKAAEARFRAGDLAGAIEWASSYRPSAARFETNEWPRETDIQLIYARIRIAQGRPGGH